MTTNALNQSVSWLDRLAISLSALCFAHCLFMPVLLIALPSLSGSFLSSETFHLWLIFVVIPTSLFALGLGCKQHRKGQYLLIGSFGLGFLLMGANVESLGLGHNWEKIFTALGALLIAFAHISNYRLCRKSKDCSCH